MAAQNAGLSRDVRTAANSGLQAGMASKPHMRSAALFASGAYQSRERFREWIGCK